MKKAEFISKLENSRPNEDVFSFIIFIPKKATVSGEEEAYDIIIFKNNSSLYKLAWEKSGNPKMPDLKEEIKQSLVKATNNKTTYLTSGFVTYKGNDSGMGSAEEVWELLALFRKNGFVPTF